LEGELKKGRPGSPLVLLCIDGLTLIWNVLSCEMQISGEVASFVVDACQPNAMMFKSGVFNSAGFGWFGQKQCAINKFMQEMKMKIVRY